MGRVQLLCLLWGEHLVVGLGWMAKAHFGNVQVLGGSGQNDLGVGVGDELDLKRNKHEKKLCEQL